jgi:hypothetical protein
MILKTSFEDCCALHITNAGKRQSYPRNVSNLVGNAFIISTGHALIRP